MYGNLQVTSRFLTSRSRKGFKINHLTLVAALKRPPVAPMSLLKRLVQELAHSSRGAGQDGSQVPGSNTPLLLCQH